MQCPCQCLGGTGEGAAPANVEGSPKTIDVPTTFTNPTTNMRPAPASFTPLSAWELAALSLERLELLQIVETDPQRQTLIERLIEKRRDHQRVQHEAALEAQTQADLKAAIAARDARVAQKVQILRELLNDKTVAGAEGVRIRERLLKVLEEADEPSTATASSALEVASTSPTVPAPSTAPSTQNGSLGTDGTAEDSFSDINTQAAVLKSEGVLELKDAGESPSRSEDNPLLVNDGSGTLESSHDELLNEYEMIHVSDCPDTALSSVPVATTNTEYGQSSSSVGEASQEPATRASQTPLDLVANESVEGKLKAQTVAEMRAEEPAAPDEPESTTAATTAVAPTRDSPSASSDALSTPTTSERAPSGLPTATFGQPSFGQFALEQTAQSPLLAMAQTVRSAETIFGSSTQFGQTSGGFASLSAGNQSLFGQSTRSSAIRTRPLHFGASFTEHRK
ncbi:hypothetical protein DFJ73DRAFT_428920 [Zopfochytrium polystomum]|nr:hypothetical protein DFJ73DRAFT_428920 [Zopfochytrium polystomum]